MNENYQKLTSLKSSGSRIVSKIKGISLFCALMLLIPILDASAQTYTLGTGALGSNTLGVTPYSTSNINSRSQYLYLAEEMLDQGANSGNIMSFAMKITELGLPTVIRPENISVKMGTTLDVVFGTSLVSNLPVYYSATMLPIDQTGWFTITLDAPFEWDGEKNIILEICRSNSYNGTSFSVESTLFNQTDYRTVGLFSNDAATPGCSLTGNSQMIAAARRSRPNIRFTMTNPCSGNPSLSGVTVVSSNASCNGTPFTLSVANGAVESGLAYQWESAPSGNGPWSPIFGAINTVYTTQQSVSTWYRRATECMNSGAGLFSTPIQVGGAGCYCTTGSLNENDNGITNVTFNLINNTSTSENPFTNFTNIITLVNRGETYNLSVNVNTLGGTNFTMAWIDWNNNGEFETSEQVSLGTVTSGANVNSGTIATVMVPMNAVQGQTVMRVRTKQSGDSSYPTPCEIVANGEAEDYTIDVREALSTNDFGITSSNVIVYSYAEGLKVAINQSSIEAVHVYDISGRLVLKKQQINLQEVAIPLAMKGQVAIVKVTTAEGLVVNKKVILN